MTAQFADLSRKAAADGSIDDTEVMALRAAGWADGQIRREEAEALFAAQQANASPSPVWSDFFVEAIRNHVLNGSEPRGYASEAEAEWLIAMVEADGKVCSLTELELLVQVIERGLGVPLRLSGYVLGVLEQAVLTGTGPTRDGGELSDTHVSAAEVRMIRRVVFGSASDRPAAISRSEAELMFRLKDATLHQANDPEFKRLFVQTVGNYLMAYSAPQLDRARVLELEAFMADNQVRVGRFVGAMAKAAPNAFGVVFGKRRNEGPDHSDKIADAQQVTVFEQEWLDAMIDSNGEVDAYDQALLEFLAEESGQA